MSHFSQNRPSADLGRVILVGAGPGAADLITVRGMRALASADCVLYDDLANAQLLEHCPPKCEKVYVGKRLGSHSATQEWISQLLVTKAREGLHVVRLKGGDPMVFGRVGEELQTLVEAGIAWEIVPGVTAASAASALTGIPLTQRGVCSTMVTVTGHPCGGKGATQVDWKALAQLKATLCIYMGTKRFAEIADELIAGGLSPETGVAVISSASLSSQTLRIGKLGDGATLLDLLERSPALILVGEVVRWSEVIRGGRTRGDRVRTRQVWL